MNAFKIVQTSQTKLVHNYKDTKWKLIKASASVMFNKHYLPVWHENEFFVIIHRFSTFSFPEDGQGRPKQGQAT